MSAAQAAGPEAPTSSHEVSPWAVLRNRAFAWLWLGVLISGTGTWMQAVGAQWLLVRTPGAGALVALVQVAATLPVMLMALPAGVIADAFDRRRMLIGVQVYFLVAGLLLLVLSLMGPVPPAVLLLFTLALALGGAVQLPAWQAITPELVPRDRLRAAARLEMVGVNLSRSIGPALAGVIIAAVGVPTVFGLNAVSVLPLGLALLLWRRPRAQPVGTREPFVPALRAGARYAWQDGAVRGVLVRLAVFILPAAAMWALLPLVASSVLRTDAAGYGVLFAGLGIGAILGALVLGRLRARLSNDAILTAAGLVLGAALAVLVVLPGFSTALVALLLAGTSWTATISLLVGEMQVLLPAWVRARGMALYTVVFTGSQAVGALIWGLVATAAGVRWTFIGAGVLEIAVAVVAVATWRLPEAGAFDTDPVAYWDEARLLVAPEPRGGAVLVAVRYTVAPAMQADFLVAMQALRRSRRRTGAIRWELYRDGERENGFVEHFRVASWEEHARQHDGRLTALDRAVERTALEFSDPPARAQHLLPPAG